MIRLAPGHDGPPFTYQYDIDRILSVFVRKIVDIHPRRTLTGIGNCTGETHLSCPSKARFKSTSTGVYFGKRLATLVIRRPN